jgi:hypothetical protein
MLAEHMGLPVFFFDFLMTTCSFFYMDVKKQWYSTSLDLSTMLRGRMGGRVVAACILNLGPIEEACNEFSGIGSISHSERGLGRRYNMDGKGSFVSVVGSTE